MVERNSFTPVYGAFDINEVAIHREAFGWTTINFDSNRVYMQRDTSTKDYNKLNEYENQYNKALEIYRVNDKKLKDVLVVENIILFLYVVLIIPIIYLFIKKRIAIAKRKSSLMTMQEMVNMGKALKNNAK